MALLTREFKKKGVKEPIIFGVLAVEIYTQGSYTTGDIDIKAEIALLEEILHKWRFRKIGRVWFNEDLDIYIDWLGNNLDEGEEAERRVNKVLIGANLEIKILSIEDLLIDRLHAYKWWQDEDSFFLAKVLLRVKEGMGEKIDTEYLIKRAPKEQIVDVLKELLKDE